MHRWLPKFLLGLWSRPFDPINHPYAKATTPDEIIGAGIAQLIIKDFDNWSYSEGRCYVNLTTKEEYARSSKRKGKPCNWEPSPDYQDQRVGMLIHREKGISITWKLCRASRDFDGFSPWVYARGAAIITRRDGPDIPLDIPISDMIFETYDTLKKQTAEARRIAREAEAAMRLNEIKWNFAETLLGMKRNSQGALVPITDAEGNPN